MSDQSDSQNKSEEQAQLSEGTSSSSSYDEGSRSTPSNLPKAATRTRKKKTSDSEDEDYVAVEDEATSNKEVMKEYGSAATTKPGMKTKVPSRRVPMSKARASTQETLESEPKKAAEEGMKKERKRGIWCKKVHPMAEFEVFFFLVLVAAFGKLLGVLLLPSSEELEGLVPSLIWTFSSDLFWLSLLSDIVQANCQQTL